MGIGFAVPSNFLRDNLAALEKGGYSDVYSDKARLGVQEIDLNAYPDNVRSSLGLPAQGEMITGVQPGSPAAQAGLQAANLGINTESGPLPAGGDVITSVDGQQVTDAQSLQNAIFAQKPGDTVTLGVWRNNGEQNVKVKLEVVPLAQTQPTTMNQGQRGLQTKNAHAMMRGVPETPLPSYHYEIRSRKMRYKAALICFWGANDETTIRRQR